MTASRFTSNKEY